MLLQNGIFFFIQNLRIEYKRERRKKNVICFLFAFYFMQLFIPIRLNDLEAKDIKKGNFLKLFTFPSLIFLYPCHFEFFTMYIFWLFYTLMKFVSKLIYNIYSFKFSNNKQTKPQHSATIVRLQRFITNVQCCTM